jgi:hypothetical protein
MTDQESLDATSDWRRLSAKRTRHIDTPKIMSDGILSLTGGTLVSLRNTATGDLMTIWSPSIETRKLHEGFDGIFVLTDDFPVVGRALEGCEQ